MTPDRPPFHRSATLKLVGVGFLALLMAIPLTMLDGLRREREGRRNEAESALASSFGAAQLVGAPLLRVPVDRVEQGADQVSRIRRYWLYQVPDRVDANAQLTIERRRRGIFELPVYAADVTLKTRFAEPRRGFGEIDGEAQWALAELVLGISDPRGMRRIEAKFDGTQVARTESLGEGPGNMAMFKLASVILTDADSVLSGEVKLALGGSSRFDWLPLAREYRAQLQAPWTDPSYTGAFSPARSTISNGSSLASWQVLEFNRNLPAVFTLGALDSSSVRAEAFGVALYQPGDVYQRNERTLKFGLLVIALTFGVFFLFETLTGLRLHPVQYLLVGTVLVAGYAAAALRKPRHGVLIGAWLALLYATLYVLVGAEDFAMLAGSGLVLALIAATMYLTRRIDWYAFGAAPIPPPLPHATEHAS